MKSLIVYYSYTENTKRTAYYLEKVLGQKGEVNICGLEPTDESDNFLMQCIRAFFDRRAELSPGAIINLAGYDLLCIGTPVWAFSPVPAVNTYLDECQNLDGKDAICFVTYGSGVGVGRCINTMKMMLKEKGALKLSSFAIQQGKVQDEQFMKEKIDTALAEIGL